MDNRKKDMVLSREKGRRAGWEVGATPAPVHRPLPPATKTPAPLPEPEPPAQPEKCGYCITLGMAYIPMQEFEELYEAEEGFARGTIFAELDLPFMGKGDCRRD